MLSNKALVYGLGCSGVMIIIVIFLLTLRKTLIRMFRRPKILRVRGIKNRNQSCFFNTVMQTLASLDSLFTYLEDSRIVDDSLTTNLYTFLREIRIYYRPVNNLRHYKKIMSFLNKSGQFKPNELNSADELFLCIIKKLFEEEMEYKEIYVKNFENVKPEVYNRIYYESVIFRYFGFAYFKKNICITFSVFSPGFENLNDSIEKFVLQTNDNFIPDWKEGVFVYLPKYYFTVYTINCLNTKEMRLKNNNKVKINATNYKLISLGLYSNSDLGAKHYVSLSKRDEVFYLFNDEIIKIIDVNKPIEIDSKITYTVYERIENKK